MDKKIVRGLAAILPMFDEGLAKKKAERGITGKFFVIPIPKRVPLDPYTKKEIRVYN